MRVSCVLLTMGDRPVELARAVDSVRAQSGDAVEIVVVGNGADPGELPGVTVVRLPDNVGIPEGRNAGVAASTGEIVLFLDDDGWYEDRAVVDRLRVLFASSPRLGVVSMRISDPDGGTGERRHVPRLRAGDPTRSSGVTTFLGGACAVRRAVFDEVGGFAGEFFYGHEETDFAWRALDAGWSLRYDAEVVMSHPSGAPSRHRGFYRYNARNRVWLARRNLPWPLATLYLLDWLLLTVVREHSARALRPWFAGFLEGWRTPCGARRPIRWRTALVMTRAGRPPLI